MQSLCCQYDMAYPNDFIIVKIVILGYDVV